MYFPKLKFKQVIPVVLGVVMSVQAIYATYIPNAHDTKLPPDTITYEIMDPSSFELLYETTDFKYYFKDERDVMAVVDKRNGYTWKTGLDIAFNKTLEDACDLVPDDQKINCEPLEDRLNTTYTGMANSLITVEYYDVSKSIKRISSASINNVKSTLGKVNNSDDHYRLDVTFSEIQLNVKVHLLFDEDGFTLEIRDEEITGDGQSVLAAIQLMPFFGASGGQKLYWDNELGDFKKKVPNKMIEGYVLVPDGPGALIRFEDRNVGLTAYTGDIYGKDPGECQYFYTNEQGFFPFKNPTMPIYGIAHGNRQAAFIAFSTKGAPYMTLNVSPEEDITYYTYAYPRFEYNLLFHQVYNKRGDGYFTLMKERRHYDVGMRYEFLANDTDRPADYVGMALTYRDYLLKNKLLPDQTQNKDDIGIRLDFVMADVKKSILGVEDVVVTRASDVKKILNQLHEDGVFNINSGLLGWQSGGITSGHPGKTEWSNAIGSKSSFMDLIETATALGYDVSLSQDYIKIHRDQVNYETSAARHVNSWYLETRMWGEYPVTEFGFAKPTKSAAWIKSQSTALAKLKVTSFTIDGISSTLTSDYDGGFTSLEESIALYQKVLSELDPAIKISMNGPNDYLWNYVDRYLSAPVFSTQFLIETDTVPFLQLVLNDTMEMYAPYSNFSFYTQKDVLRMIDYNLYPSFALSQDPAYVLALTNANKFYSTEFTEYELLINTIYDEVNGSLKEVIGDQWVDREVLANGIILNTYASGKQILINYTQDPTTYQGKTVRALSAMVFKELAQ